MFLFGKEKVMPVPDGEHPSLTAFRDKVYAGRTFVDATWPGPPDITAANPFDGDVKAELTADLKARFG